MKKKKTGDGRIEYDEDRWHFTVKGDCWAEKEEGEIRVWIEIKEVGEASMVKKGEMLLCRKGNTKEEMTESLMETKEGRWPIGRVERTLVCREADTRMAASGRAAHVRGRKTLPLHMCGFVWLCVALCGDVWRCVALCGVVWGCVALCGVVWRRVASCGVAWRCVTLRGVVWHCIALCGVALR